ncbi:MAG: heavy-metal-associated domain-containing protein [Betaproteobacteria bacterium]|nr:heavy-metal-associated domain-containing protein [Betaproteobacteria bacterium]
MAVTIQLRVIGGEKIHCAGCEARIGYALRRLPGIQEVRASAETQAIAVTIDPDQISAEQIRARIEQLGYQVA